MKANKGSFIFLLLGLVSCLFVACNKDDEEGGKTVVTKDVVLKNNESYTIDLGSSADVWEFTSQDPSIATVTQVGKIKGILVGKTKVFATNTTHQKTDTFNVTVNPSFTFFREPCLTFYVKQPAIENYEQRAYWGSYAYADGGFYIYFEGENDFVYVVFYIFNKEHKYYWSEVEFGAMYVEDVNHHVELRYKYIGEQTYDTWGYTTTYYEDGTVTRDTTFYNISQSYYLNQDSSMLLSKYTQNGQYCYLDYYASSDVSITGYWNDQTSEVGQARQRSLLPIKDHDVIVVDKDHPLGPVRERLRDVRFR